MSEPKQKAPSDMPAEKMKESKTTVIQSIAKGSVAGAVEVLIDHPLWSIKTRLQRGDVFTLNPRLLYRGILTNATSMIPVTAIQVSLNRAFQKVFFHGVTEFSHGERVASAFVAGVGSSFVSCPTEMAMTYQSKVGGTIFAAGKHLIGTGGVRSLWTALPATAMREGVFTSFFLAVTPILKMRLETNCVNEHVASLTAGMGAGLGAAVVSQTFDTIKTTQQTSGASFREAARRLYSARGVYGFFKGGLPRGLNVMSALTIMGCVNEKMETWLCENNQDSEDILESSMQKVKK